MLLVMFVTRLHQRFVTIVTRRTIGGIKGDVGGATGKTVHSRSLMTCLINYRRRRSYSQASFTRNFFLLQNNAKKFKKQATPTF